jgi:hypothetical protein
MEREMSHEQRDLSELPAWARPIVEDFQARKAAERAAAERQEAEDSRRKYEEAALASRRAAEGAVHMGHMANVTGAFVRAVRPRVTAVVSTPEQRHFEAVRYGRLQEQRTHEVRTRSNSVPARPR